MALDADPVRERWEIAPKLTPAEPDLRAMLARADAALVIGDPALALNPSRRHGVMKIDLGAEWQALTGLPFVYAMWSGRDGRCGPEHVRGAAGGARSRRRRVADDRARDGRGDPARERGRCDT